MLRTFLTLNSKQAGFTCNDDSLGPAGKNREASRKWPALICIHLHTVSKITARSSRRSRGLWPIQFWFSKSHTINNINVNERMMGAGLLFRNRTSVCCWCYRFCPRSLNYQVPLSVRVKLSSVNCFYLCPCHFFRFEWGLKFKPGRKHPPSSRLSYTYFSLS